MIKKGKLTLVGGVCLALVLVAMSINTAWAGPKPKTPSQFIVCALPAGSVGYTMMMGIGKAVKEKAGVPLRLIPGGPDIARLMPTVRRKSHFSLLVGPSTYHIAHGLGPTYSREEWGPQPIRVVWDGTPGGSSMVTRGDAGIRTLADLKGKRIAVVPGHPMFEKHKWSSHAAVLAFANLTWDEVKAVPVTSSTAGFKAVLEGAADSMLLSTSASKAYELAASRHGIWYPPFPHGDKAAWQRLQKIAPYISPRVIDVGAGPQWEGGKTFEGVDFAYSVISYPFLDDDIAYSFVKAVWEGYDLYKDAHPELKYWNHERTTGYRRLVHPYHDGVVKFFKEAGVWTPAMAKWQKRQVMFERARAAAWDKAKAEARKLKIRIGKPKFSAFWRKWLIDNNLISYPER